MKRQSTEWEKYLQTIYPIRHGYAKYLKTHTIQYVPNSKYQMPQLKNEQKT